MDRRKALGDGAPKQITEDEFFDCAPLTDPHENRLPGPYPCDRSLEDRPDIPYTGEPNPAIANSRPIADMNPRHGSGDIEEGVSFRVPMGEAAYNDADYN